MTWWRRLVVAVALASVLGTTAPARAGYLEDAGWGTLAGLSNLVYVPAKLTYSLLGGITGGLAYGLTAGRLDTAETIWSTAMGGTYVLTPRHLQGQEPVAFAYMPGAKPAVAATAPDDAAWGTADLLDEAPGGSAVGSTGGDFGERPAGGF